VAAPTIELREPPTGAGTVVSLTTGQGASLGSPVTASASNTETITVRFVDPSGASFGSFLLDAGESVDTDVLPDGTVETAVLNGIVTIQVRGESVTLNPGESHRFGSPDPTPAEVLDGLIVKVRQFMASGDIRRRGIGLGLIGQLETTKRLLARHRRPACTLICSIVLEVESLHHARLVTRAVRDALVPPLQSLGERLHCGHHDRRGPSHHGGRSHSGCGCRS
jgi:hypothetical protein